MAILLDTGVLFALLDKSDPSHDAVKKMFEQTRESFLVPAVILPEVCYLTQKYLGPDSERSFLKGLAQGELAVEWSQSHDLIRALEILETRPDFGMVDAMVMATAERLNIKKIATLDRRHFAAFKTIHGRPFELLP